jgi:hypothetical protein
MKPPNIMHPCPIRYTWHHRTHHKWVSSMRSVNIRGGRPPRARYAVRKFIYSIYQFTLL